jgi:hypothetical protein
MASDTREYAAEIVTRLQQLAVIRPMFEDKVTVVAEVLDAAVKAAVDAERQRILDHIEGPYRSACACGESEAQAAFETVLEAFSRRRAEGESNT